MLVFIDASVLVSATLSPTGGSRIIFGLEKENYLKIIMTREIVNEARLSIKKKYGHGQLVLLYELLSGFKDNIFADPTNQEIEGFTGLITDDKDRHVLAAAKKYKAHVLVTLDRRHFFTEELKAAKLPFQVELPGEFLRAYRQL